MREGATRTLLFLWPHTRAEMRLRELTSAMPKSKGGRPEKICSLEKQVSETKSVSLAKVNISRKKASQYELMAAHPDVVEQAIAETRADHRLSLRTAHEGKKAHIELPCTGFSFGVFLSSQKLIA